MSDSPIDGPTQTRIDRLARHVGETVTIRGWLAQKRSSGKIKFLVVRDGTGYLQCVAFHKDVSEELDHVVALLRDQGVATCWTPTSVRSTVTASATETTVPTTIWVVPIGE